jgi:hypothetical protein
MQKFKKIVFITLAACFFNAEAAERIALVIGNSKYEQLSSLENPKNDANAVAQKFKDMGYQTYLILDGTDKAIKRELKLFSGQSEKAKVSVIYYAGHGAQVDGENYILPTDLELPNSETDIKISSIKVDDVINAIKSKTKIIFLDACRDNPALYKNLEKGRGSVQRGLASQKSSYQVEESGGIFIAYATDSGSISEDGPKSGNSPFTAAFLKFSSELISIDDVFTKITNEVKKTTNQKQRPFKYASMDGIICLNPTCNSSLEKKDTIAKLSNNISNKKDKKWMGKNWAFIGSTKASNDFFYVDTSSIQVKNNKAIIRSINFTMGVDTLKEPTEYRVTEQVFNCENRKTFLYEGATFDTADRQLSNVVLGDWNTTEPNVEIFVGSMAFALSTIACSENLRAIDKYKGKTNWKKFYGFENQTWYFDTSLIKEGKDKISTMLKIGFPEEIDTRTEKNKINPVFHTYLYAPIISFTLMPIKINCSEKTVTSEMEINFHDDNLVFINASFDDKYFKYEYSSEGNSWLYLDKFLCEKK